MHRPFQLFSILFIAALVAVGGLLSSVGNAQTNAPTVVVATIENEITAGTAQYVRRAHARAAEVNADLFVIQLDTPGGLVTATQEIVGILLADEVPTAGFVHRAGGSAFSAGTIILLATDHAAAHPNSSLGAAQPRTIGGDSEPDPKAVAAMEAFIESIAQAKERDADLARAFVTDNTTYTGTRALEAGIIDSTPQSLNDLLNTLELGGAQIVPIEQSAFERFLSLVSLPMVASLLLTIATLGIIFSIRSGEFELILVFIPILGLALWAVGGLALSTVGVLLFVSALILISIEIASPGLGYFGISGGVLLVLSFFLFTEEPFFTLGMYGIVLYVTLGVLFGFLAAFFWIIDRSVRSLAAAPTTGIESLPGKAGTAYTDITETDGTIIVDSYRWRAMSDEPIMKGSRVRIKEVRDGIALVTPEQ